ncbi:hypothetical protein P7C71_g539, partial [Lecanoromycetidae sp. Uapishka_2]
MPSKGITVYSYISVDGYEIEFSVPKCTVRNTAADNFSSKDLEVESSNIEGLRSYTGRFEWNVYDPSGAVIGNAFNNINSLTESVIVTFGFYDAGHGEAGLPNHDQCYVTVCPTSNKSWMGAVAPPGSPQSKLPFSRFVLAAPHDNGMNSMQSADAVLSAVDKDTVADLREIVPGLHFFPHIPDETLVHILPNIVYGVSITQKKEIAVMLALGARYFEFRPAELLPMFQKVSKLPNKFYFQHACIPGIAFDDFLEQQVDFLDANPTEIVTIHIRYDNIVKECRKPTEEEIYQHLDDACSKAQRNPLTWGHRECFSRPIDELRAAGQRLIVVIMAEKYDSWTAEAYATLKADPILARFESMNTAGQKATDLTVLQCQATSQSIKEVLLYSVISANAATSCLTSTKGALDMKTLPWIRANALSRLQDEKTIVIMNDFIDGATTDTSIDLSKRRLENDDLAERFNQGLSISESSGKQDLDTPVMPGSFH